MNEWFINPKLDKNIFLLWLDGWENCRLLNKQVVESWEINNPEWKIHYIDINNLKNYVNDIDYVYNKNISPQSKSDIIRLSLLKNYGGVWADSTLLCMQPLEHWINEAVDISNFWMYHGNGGNMDKKIGPASWFIVSKKNEFIINKWKAECDKYWLNRDSTDNYFWMDSLFSDLYYKNEQFRNLWLKVPYIYCEDDGQSHTLNIHKMHLNSPHIKKLFLEKPPYVLKFWKFWDDIIWLINDYEETNGYYAIQMSKRKFCYKHNFEKN